MNGFLWSEMFVQAAIVPGFHTAYLEAMVQVFDNCAARTTEKLEKLLSIAEDNDMSHIELDMESEFSNLALDIIGLSVFNYDFGSVTKESPVIQVSYVWHCFCFLFYTSGFVSYPLFLLPSAVYWCWALCEELNSLICCEVILTTFSQVLVFSTVYLNLKIDVHPEILDCRVPSIEMCVGMDGSSNYFSWRGLLNVDWVVKLKWFLNRQYMAHCQRQSIGQHSIFLTGSFLWHICLSPDNGSSRQISRLSTTV